MAANSGVRVVGLQAYLKPLKGFAGDRRALNSELRQHSKLIATDLLPMVRDAVRSSPAPQADKMADTTRVHSDRVPVIVVGKVNPRFASGFRHKGTAKTHPADRSAKATKLRRGALAIGVLQGGLGGKRDTKADENYYRIRRNKTLGPLGSALRTNSPMLKRAEDLYVRLLLASLAAHGMPRSALRKGR